MFAISLIIACLVSVAYANSVADNLVVHESRSSVPNGFIDNGPASGNQILTLRAALVQSNVSGLEQQLYAVSTPGNELYGQHLTKKEVFRPLTLTASFLDD